MKTKGIVKNTVSNQIISQTTLAFDANCDTAKKCETNENSRGPLKTTKRNFQIKDLGVLTTLSYAMNLLALQRKREI